MESATDFILAPGLKLVHRAAKVTTMIVYYVMHDYIIKLQLLVGASRSNHLGSVKYIIDNAKNLDINVKESDRVKHSMHEFILLCLNICIILTACLDSADVGHQQG